MPRRRSRAPPRLVSATYEFPYLAHAPMEPLDAVVKLDAERLRDLGRRPVPDRRPGQRRGDRRAQAGAGQDPHALCRRQLRAARQHGLRLYRRGGLDRQGARRQRHAGQAAMDARGRHPRRPLSARCISTARGRRSTPTASWSAGSIASSASRSWPARRSRRDGQERHRRAPRSRAPPICPTPSPTCRSN